MMEWRIDYFTDVVLMNRLLEVAGKVKRCDGNYSCFNYILGSQKFGGKTELDSEDAYLNPVKNCNYLNWDMLISSKGMCLME